MTVTSEEGTASIMPPGSTTLAYLCAAPDTPLRREKKPRTRPRNAVFGTARTPEHHHVKRRQQCEAQRTRRSPAHDFESGRHNHRQRREAQAPPAQPLEALKATPPLDRVWLHDSRLPNAHTIKAPYPHSEDATGSTGCSATDTRIGHPPTGTPPLQSTPRRTLGGPNTGPCLCAASQIERRNRARNHHGNKQSGSATCHTPSAVPDDVTSHGAECTITPC